ncbi:site-2 protease family protein [candidate division WWE3 bacterium]|uniref:Site-2 protease family protein n=1 Tax=candidate division WWE3 bacterium TaxID=2053526 RepID=A0A7X9DJJ1_UNCKA|nr:site-2 protease family protein [candidate division WWE3 bacterium]
MLNILFNEPIVFFILVPVLLMSLAIHEFAHAYSADKLGDPTARYLGRVTLNPFAHLDPVGTLLLIFAGFGWGKPVPFNPINLSNPKRDSAIISFAGPFSNFIMAITAAVLTHLLQNAGVITASTAAGLIIHAVLQMFILINLSLGFFNLIPVHPLDGFKVVYGLLPTNMAAQWLQMESMGMIILLIMVMTRSVGTILDPLVQFSLRILGF